VRPNEAASSLHENERKILLALQGRESATTTDLSRFTGLRRDLVERACAWAEAKGVVSCSSVTASSFTLTEEGRTYVEDGLPEKQLLTKVASGETTIDALKASFPLLSIALVWVRRNGWGTITNGTLVLTPQGIQAQQEETEDERILHQLRNTPLTDTQLDDVSKRRVDLLLKRGLVEEVKDVERWVTLSAFGREVVAILEAAPPESVITQLTPELLRTAEWKGRSFQTYDVTLPVPSISPGKRHFISQVIDYIRRFWVELGFQEMTGEYLELSFWNFDALYQPQDHPARDLADTFYLKAPHEGRLPNPATVARVKATHEDGWTTGSTGWQYRWSSELARRNCLRTHTTSLSVKTLAHLTEADLPAKFFSVGRVFRNETVDWNHLIEFYQTDGIVVGDGVTFRNLMGYLKAYLEGLGLRTFRFRPGYFPYTEMSLEAEVWVAEKGQWMELFGAGMFRPEVVKPLFGRDVPVLAWGPGFDRLIMQSYHIATIKELYSNDLALLQRAKLWME
jgi:phenylalanyl-tRNA synthetase alpha chain